MDHLFIEILASIAASALLALMVAAGGTAMAGMRSDAAVQAEATEVDRPDPLTVCRVDGGLITCVREAT